jgi:hypothetical protein
MSVDIKDLQKNEKRSGWPKKQWAGALTRAEQAESRTSPRFDSKAAPTEAEEMDFGHLE